MIGRFIRSAGIVIMCFISAFLVLLFSWMPKGGVYPWVAHKFWGPGMLWLAGAKLHVRGAENLDQSADAVFISNHQSHFDIPSITSAVPIPLYFIAKKELQHIPIFGWGMWAIGMVFVDRNNREKALASMQKAIRAIKKGKSILSFPEGTRSKDGEVKAFKKGSFHLAKSGLLEMVPIAVSGTRDVLAPGGKLNRGVVVVQVGRRITRAEVESRSIAELATYANARIGELKFMADAELLRIKKETK